MDSVSWGYSLTVCAALEWDGERTRMCGISLSADRDTMAWRPQLSSDFAATTAIVKIRASNGWWHQCALAILLALGVVGTRAADRVVLIPEASIVRGQSNCLQVFIQTEGNENALGFSLCFDTNALQFVSARRGLDGGAITLNVNTNQVGRGRVGFAAALAFGEAFPAGNLSLVELCLRATPGTGRSTTTLSFCGAPVALEMSDVDANPLPVSYQSPVLTLIGECHYTLESSGASFSSAGGFGAVAWTAENGCAWGATNTNSWVTLLSAAEGAGNGALSYLVQPNTTPQARTGTVVIASRPYQISQAGVFCDYNLRPSIRVHGPEGGDGQSSILANSACAWTVQNPNPWIAITTPLAGSGDGVVGYSVSPYAGFVARTGLVAVAGQTLSIVQLPVPCTFSLSPTSRVHSAVSEFNIVNVAAPEGCDWTIDNRNDWILIKLTTNGTGSGIARYTVFANDRPVARSGIITIAGQPFTVEQLPAACNFTLLQTSRYIGAEGATGIVQFATLDECPWVASNTNAWVEMAAITNGIGGGTLGWAVGPNFSSSERTGYITVAGQAYRITQYPTRCSSSISPSSRAISSGSNTGNVNVSVSSACSNVQWRVYNPNSWITVHSGLTGNRNGTVRYSVQPYQDFGTRTGYLHIADRRFTITQTGIACTYALTPTSRSHTYAAETNTITFTVSGLCGWSASSSASWLVLMSAGSGNGSATLQYRTLINTGAARTATITAQGRTFTVSQGAATAVSITTQPTSQGVAIGGTAMFRVVAAGTAPLSYQWRLNGVNLANSTFVSGATSDTLTLSNVQPGQAGNYSVVVSNLRGSVTSGNAALQVNTPPTLDPIPDRTTVRGAIVALNARATDTDLPAQTITYSLAPGAPAGATINATSGAFAWTAAASVVPSTVQVTVRAVDSGTPPLTNARTFRITIQPGYVTNQVLIPFGAVWRYRDTGENLGTNWVGLGYSDAAWASGPAPLGYGNGTEATVVGFGGDTANRYPTTYFRHRFSVGDAATFSSLALRFVRDDGVVFHLNGVELLRDNMPAGLINYGTFSTSGIGSGEEGVTNVSPSLSPARLSSGSNVLALELHNSSVSSGDIAIDAELSGQMIVSAPALLAQPAPRAVLEGMEADFEVVAASALPKEQQWYFNGSLLPGQTNEMLRVLAAQPGDAGSYFAIVRNSLGSVTSAVASLTVTQAPNLAPIIAPVADRTLGLGESLAVTIFAFDVDQPPQSLEFALEPGAPAEAEIDVQSGLLRWTPPQQAASTNRFTVRVTDSGTPPHSALASFNVYIRRAPRLLGVSLIGGTRAALTWESQPGRRYRIQFANDPTGAWTDFPTETLASSTVSSFLDSAGASGQRFYRVVLLD